MPDYKIIVLGLSGSGKTVYLASLYEKLQVSSPIIGFFLDIEDNINRNKLIKTYSQVASVDSPWPPGTVYGEVSEWKFKCSVQLKNLTKFTACEFTYLDYAGGKINDPTNDDPKLTEKIRTADAFLGFLDGEKVLDLMCGNKDRLALNLDYLNYIIPFMQNAGINNPVHFVITKWDILENQFSLKEIRDKLLEIRKFKDIVANRIAANSKVRLIPVSALGKGFAVLENTPDGKKVMRKVTNSIPHPFQVEMPLACVLPDIIKVRLNEIKELKQEEIGRSTKVEPNLSLMDKLRLNVAYVANSVFPGNPEIIQNIIEWIEKEPKDRQKTAAQRSQELQKMKEEKLKNIRNEESAFEYVLSCFLQIEHTLSTRFRESEINLEDINL